MIKVAPILTGFMLLVSISAIFIPSLAKLGPTNVLLGLFLSQFEVDIFRLIPSVIALYQLGTYLETIDATRFHIVALLSTFIPNVITLMIAYIMYVLSGTEEASFDAYGYNGPTSLLAGLFVALTQNLVDYKITFFSIISFQMQYLNFFYSSTYFVLTLILPRLFALDYVNSVLGFFIAWIYLRFYLKDYSTTFSYNHFYPVILHPFGTPIVRILHRLFTALHIVSSPTSAEQAMRPKGTMEQLDAERRRALALKTLELRLSKSTSSIPVSIKNAGNKAPILPQ